MAAIYNEFLLNDVTDYWVRNEELEMWV